MNYLAHAYLSFNEPATITGQMIADFVKGKEQLQRYPPAIQKGIGMHRALDEFTDKHPATRRAKAIFQPTCGPYGGVFMDIVYDHYLANDATRFTLPTLQQFASHIYSTLHQQEHLLPPRFQQVLYYMSSQNWLFEYHEKEGIFSSFSGIVRRAKYFKQPASVPFSVFEEHYQTLGNCYREFFPDAVTFMNKLNGEL